MAQQSSIVLLIDGIINLILGIVLLTFQPAVLEILGIPGATVAFYPSILGAVLTGIAIALFVEYFKKPSGLRGLGLGGAIAINLCGGIVLAYWLLFENLALPIQGQIVLWCLVFILLFISGLEWSLNK